MLLYRTQPKSSTKTNIINLQKKRELVNSLAIDFKGKRIEYNDAVTLLTDASIISGIISSSGYGNILVVTSFEDKNYDRLRDRNYRPVNSAGDHFLPIIHKANECEGKMTVTTVKNSDNYLKSLYEEYSVDTIETESYFRLDGDFRIKTPEHKFDAVVLLGSESFKKGSFKSSDIRKKFEKYCINGFDLIDIYRSDKRRISGGSQDISNHVERMIECVNTPTKVYDRITRVVPSADYMGYKRQELLHYRLALNLEKINEYYRVYSG